MKQKPLILKGGSVALDGVPETIRVLPLGRVDSSKGTFFVDAESFQLMTAGIAKRGVDLVVDYEHQTLGGGEAPAAGWVKALRMGDGYIEADVDWTARGSEYLKNREYRYLSPVVTVRKSDGKATGLHSLALTNTPAIENMTAIVNSENFEGGNNNMDFRSKLIQLLGLEETATDDQIEEAVEARLNSGGENVVANKAVCELLGLKAGAPASDVAAKIQGLQTTIATRTATEAVELALKDGKITPAQKDWAQSYALSDPKGFADFVLKAPKVVPMGEMVTGAEVKGTGVGEETMKVCKMLGLSEEDVQKYNKEG